MNELRAKIEAIIFDAVSEVNRQLPPGSQIERRLDSLLFGKGSDLDSLGLVSLAIETETRVFDQLGVSITIADERAVSLKASPFRTIATFADYVEMLVGERANESK